MPRRKSIPKKVRDQPSRIAKKTPTTPSGSTNSADQSTSTVDSSLHSSILINTENMPDNTMRKFSLPNFDETDPEWFEVVDTIFATNEVVNEAKRFSHILEKLITDHFRSIRDIVNSDDDNVKKSAYTLAKAKLILVLGESKERKLDKLLSASDIPTNAKPSLVLQFLRDRAGKS